ncbi:MAG: glycine zipper domain-containing protein [Pseudomonadales bacterium]|nr:glycine zipper domain-containing protein [Pseudomonadales bacterium]
MPFYKPAFTFLFVVLLSACTSVEDFTGRKPIVDMKNVSLAQYDADMAECEAYANQVEVGRQTAVAAGAGAAAGAVIGAITGDDAGEGAGVGAVAGTLSGAGSGLDERQRVIRNCLIGRGYRVLN